MNTRTHLILSVLPSLSALAALAAPPSLIVVEDRGGVSALPYYQALNPQPNTPRETPVLPLVAPPAPAGRGSDTDVLPIRSTLLTPGEVTRRVIQAPGLSPIFLIGDDERSRAWLHQRINTLLKLGAIGLVVNVESATALDALRRLAPGLTLASTPGDDLAQRLRLQHYPALITATGIEQ
jgi:integrating conjugative element protein (TIGR03765 family)